MWREVEEDRGEVMFSSVEDDRTGNGLKETGTQREKTNILHFFYFLCLSLLDVEMVNPESW